MDSARRTDRATRAIAAEPAAFFATMPEAKALERWLAPTGSSLAINEFRPEAAGLAAALENLAHCLAT